MMVTWVDDNPVDDGYLTSIPRTRMGSESIARNLGQDGGCACALRS